LIRAGDIIGYNSLAAMYTKEYAIDINDFPKY
jgi:hypothetical protein